MDMYSFYIGRCFDAYEYLGAHSTEAGVVFRTFAPAARGVSLLWEDRELPMEPVYDGNFYQLTVSEARPGDRYQYRVHLPQGGGRTTATPTAFRWSCGLVTGP